MKTSWKLLLIYTFFVILWGAFVRASGSGDGCGAHWPTCHGDVLIDSSYGINTFIEYFHRGTSGLYGIFVLLLSCLTIFNSKFTKETKLYAFGVLFFTVLESLIGAKLVLSELVGQNTSFARAVVMMIHLSNTLILVACTVGVLVSIDKRKGGATATTLKILKRYSPFLVFFFLTGASGALAALGDSLYPSESLLEGFAMDFDPTSPFLIKVRAFHPFFAFILSMMVILKVSLEKKAGVWLLGIAIFALALGVINLVLLAPIWMQILHLLTALIYWVTFLYYAFEKE